MKGKWDKIEPVKNLQIWNWKMQKNVQKDLAGTGKKVGRKPGESIVKLTKRRLIGRERSQYYHELQTVTIRTKKTTLDR